MSASLISSMKAIATSKGKIKRALSFVKNKSSIPSALSVETTHSIATLASELGFSVKLFERPIIQAINILSLDEDEVLQQFEASIAKDVFSFTSALPQSETKLINAVKKAGEEKLDCWVDAYSKLSEDVTVMLRYQGKTKEKFIEEIKARMEKAKKEQEESVEA